MNWLSDIGPLRLFLLGLLYDCLDPRDLQLNVKYFAYIVGRLHSMWVFFVWLKVVYEVFLCFIGNWDTELQLSLQDMDGL